MSSGLPRPPPKSWPAGKEGIGGLWPAPVSRGLRGGGGGLSSSEDRLRRGASARLRSSPEGSVRRRRRTRTVLFSPSELPLEKRRPSSNRGDEAAPDRSAEDVARAGAHLGVLLNKLFFIASPSIDWSAFVDTMVQASLDASDRHVVALHALTQYSTRTLQGCLQSDSLYHRRTQKTRGHAASVLTSRPGQQRQRPTLFKVVLVTGYGQLSARLPACGRLPAQFVTCQNASQPEEGRDAGKTISDGRGAKDTLKPKQGRAQESQGNVQYKQAQYGE